VRAAAALLALAACQAEPADCDPATTWEGFSQGFFIEYCQGCHASAAPGRYGAPAEVTFDTQADVLAWRDRALARLTDDTMPPGGGVPSADLDRVTAWLACAE
jgi:hypothetical protein